MTHPIRTRALAALGVATIGLSTLASTTSAFASTATPRAVEHRITGPLVFTDGHGHYTPALRSADGKIGVGATTDSLAAATAKAAVYHLPDAGETGKVQVDDQCLRYSFGLSTIFCSLAGSDPTFDFTTARTAGGLSLTVSQFSALALSATSGGVNTAPKGEAGAAQTIVASNFTSDETGKPPADGVALDDLTALQSDGAAFILGRAEPGATITVTRGGKELGRGTTSGSETIARFDVLAIGTEANQELTVTASTADGRSTSKTVIVRGSTLGPISADPAHLAGDTLTITGRGTPGAEVTASGFHDPAAVSGSTTVGKDGRYTLKAAVASSSSARAAQELLVTLTQKTATSTDVTYLRYAGEPVADTSLPAVFRSEYDFSPTDRGGFTLDAAGHLVSSNFMSQTAEQAAQAAGVERLVVKPGLGTITDASGKKCLADAGSVSGRYEVVMAACTGERAQQWIIQSSGQATNLQSNLDLQVKLGAAGTPAVLTLARGNYLAKFTAPKPTDDVAFTLNARLAGDLTVSGRGRPSSDVLFTTTVNGKESQVLNSAPVRADGTWSAYATALQLASDPNVTVTATQSLFGNEERKNIGIDAKNTVRLRGLANGDSVTPGQTCVAGTAQRGAPFTVKDGDRVIAEGVATGASRDDAGQGDFGVVLPQLPEGEHTLTVEQKQKGGATSSTAVTVEVAPGRRGDGTAGSSTPQR